MAGLWDGKVISPEALQQLNYEIQASWLHWQSASTDTSRDLWHWRYQELCRQRYEAQETTEQAQ